MLDSLPVALAAGTALGFLAGLGVGGGSLLILWLTLVLSVPQEEARIINLMFFVPAAVVSCLFRWKQGNLKLRKVLPAIIAGCLSAACLSVFADSFDEGLIKKLFGVLLLFTGIRELCYRPRKLR